ncbi:AIR carboxylase family protein [Vibrio cholerae]|nr:AIR carboxylase family protein [Vibrio cholerae]
MYCVPAPLNAALYANQILSIKKDLAWKKLRE